MKPQKPCNIQPCEYYHARGYTLCMSISPFRCTFARCTTSDKNQYDLARFLNALKWSMAGELASRAIQPAVFVILARLLTPDAYGVMAAAIMVISFTQVFWEAGMGKAIIQRQTRVAEASNVAFWINLGLGMVIAGLLFLGADFIANTFFGDARVADVLRVMTIQIILGALGSVHTAQLQKKMRFSQLFWVRLCTVAIPALFSVPLAVYGYSYWALVIGTLAGQVGQVVMLWRINRWRPKWSFNYSMAKDLGRFSFWVGLTSLLAWFYVWADSLFVGTFLGTNDLGLYRTANQFMTMVFGFLFTPLLPVLYSYFSKAKGDVAKLITSFNKVLRIVVLVSIPLGFILHAIAGPISAIVFGEKWIGIEFVLAVMALAQGYAWIVGVNGELYRAMGKPSLETYVNLTTLVVYAISYYISIQYGLEVFVWTRLGLVLVAIVNHIVFARISIGLRMSPMIRMILISTAIGSLALVIGPVCNMISQNAFINATLICVFCAMSMGLIVYLLEKDRSVKDIAALIKNRHH